ncbi:hypothetical protein D3C71_1272860 [compost metagenome]
MHKPTPRELAQAHAIARLRGTVADALRWPALARCLEITAEAMRSPRHGALSPPAAGPPQQTATRPTEAPTTTQPRRDYKRLCAADNDEA